MARFRVYATDGSARQVHDSSVAMAASAARAIVSEGKVAVVDRGGVFTPTVLVRAVEGGFDVRAISDEPSWAEDLRRVLEAAG